MGYACLGPHRTTLCTGIHAWICAFSRSHCGARLDRSTHSFTPPRDRDFTSLPRHHGWVRTLATCSLRFCTPLFLIHTAGILPTVLHLLIWITDSFVTCLLRRSRIVSWITRQWDAPASPAPLLALPHVHTALGFTAPPSPLSAAPAAGPPGFCRTTFLPLFTCLDYGLGSRLRDGFSVRALLGSILAGS